MATSEEETKNFLEKMFKLDCDMDTSIRQAYIKGFSRGFEVKNALKKIQKQEKREKCKIWEIIDDCEYFTAKCVNCGYVADSRILPSKCPGCGKF